MSCRSHSTFNTKHLTFPFPMWSARRILTDLTDRTRRRAILTAFWRYGDDAAKAMAAVQLARALHFLDETIRRMSIEKKAEQLAGRAGAAEFEQTFETALMLYHTR